MSTSKIRDICKVLIDANKQQRISFLHFADKKTCKIIREIAYNILLNDTIELEAKERLYMRNRLEALKTLASKFTSIYQRREILVDQHLLIKKLAHITLKHLDTLNDE